MSRLKKYILDDVDLFYSTDIKSDFNLNDEKSLEYYISVIMQKFLERNYLYRELINLNSIRRGLESRKAILDAHGESEDNVWMYRVGDKVIPVQNWINRMDGKYTTLVLHCCNVGSYSIYSKKSAILVPDNTYSEMLCNIGECNIELYIPGKGYISSYTIESDLVEMKKSLNN